MIAIALSLSNNLLGQDLKVWDKILVYRVRSEIYEIKRLSNDQSYYGYDIFSENMIFLAYQKPGYVEPIIILSIYNVDNSQEKIIGEVGASSDSFFSLNANKKKIVFNSWDGIRMIDIGEIDSKSHLKNNSKLIQTRLLIRQDKESPLFYPFWVNDSTIIYIENGEKGNNLRKYILKK